MVLIASFGLLLLAILIAVLQRAYLFLPLYELRRRATKGDRYAAALAGPAVYANELRLLSEVLVILLVSGAVLLLSLSTPAVLYYGALVLVLLAVILWQRSMRITQVSVRLAALVAPSVTWLLTRLHPALNPLATWAGRYTDRTHTGLYEVDDVRALLSRQLRQRDNRVRQTDLELLERVLSFSDQRVSDLMTPRKRVRAVKATESISPVFVDELHRSGHAYFPVYEDNADNVIGLLALRRVADVAPHDTALSVMDNHLAYLNADDDLGQAVRAFYETHEHLFIVVDAHEKYLGVLTLSDILQYVFGKLESRTFGRHDDRGAVTHKTVAKK